MQMERGKRLRWAEGTTQSLKNTIMVVYTMTVPERLSGKIMDIMQDMTVGTVQDLVESGLQYYGLGSLAIETLSIMNPSISSGDDTGRANRITVAQQVSLLAVPLVIHIMALVPQGIN